MLNNNQINTNKPRDSLVFADGDYVIKYPTATNPAHVGEWVKRQQHARDVVNGLLSYNGNRKLYFIPKIVEISDKTNAYIREERVYGKPITQDLFFSLNQTQQDIIYNTLAIFISDMNQHMPVLDITSQFQMANGKDFIRLLTSVRDFISDEDFTLINNAYELLKLHSNKMPSRVFFHGDMNENNIFFDITTNTVSFIDFTEARYENADYMFFSDLSRLQWLDTNKLIERYKNTTKQRQITIIPDKGIVNIFNCLRTIQSTCNSIINQPKMASIYNKILHENIQKLETAYNSVNGQRGRGAIGSETTLPMR